MPRPGRGGKKDEMKTEMTYILAAAIALSSVAACAEKDLYPETGKDWDNITDFLDSDDEKQFTTYYKPYVGTVADPMPFYDEREGNFKILYLQDYQQNQEGTYHPFWCLETLDCASYASMGEVLPCGSIEEQDAALGTGCAVYDEASGLYHIYYTGNRYQPTATESAQVVMRATSRDFKTWTKDLAFSIKGVDNGYSRKDFRDPCVFRDDDGKWRMVVATVRGGTNVLADYISDDLSEWRHNGDFMTTVWNRFYECPDIFKMGDWWYLVYSDVYDQDRKVHYLKGRTLAGLADCGPAALWPDNKDGILDSRAWYAAKTASDGQSRYIWGWCPVREGEDNSAVKTGWGGALVCHKLGQNADGTLFCTAPETIKSKYAENCPVRVMDGASWTESGESYTIGEGGYILFSRLARHNLLSFDIVAEPGDRFGFSFLRGGDSKLYYSLIVNPEDGNTRRKLNLEETGGKGFLDGGDSYFFPNAADGVYHITVITDNSVCTVYINDVLNYTCRLYDLARNCWSIDSYAGEITVNNLEIHKY